MIQDSYVALVTPFKKNGIDYLALENLKRLIKAMKKYKLKK